MRAATAVQVLAFPAAAGSGGGGRLATLPLLLAMERGNTAQRELIRHAIEHGEVARLPDIVEIVRHTGAVAATRDAARAEANKAAAALDVLPKSIFREALLEFPFRSVDRSF